MAIEEVISAQAVARYIRMSPTKVRRVLNQIRGCTYVATISSWPVLSLSIESTMRFIDSSCFL